jgi:TPR repeat protein
VIQGGIGARQDLPAADSSEIHTASVAPEAADLVRKGDVLLKSGDLAAARQFYERAYAQGAAAGAMGVAKTYDPVVFAELNVQGIVPDPAKAMEWYKRAEDQGLPDAASAIEALQALGQ